MLKSKINNETDSFLSLIIFMNCCLKEHMPLTSVTPAV